MFLPVDIASFSRGEAQRLRMAVVASLLAVSLALIFMVLTYVSEGASTYFEVLVSASGVLLLNAFMPRWLRSYRTPGYGLCLLSAVTIFLRVTYEGQTHFGYWYACFPVFAVMLVSPRLAVGLIVFGAGHMLFVAMGPGALRHSERLMAMDAALETMVMGGIALIGESFRQRMERERDEAQAESLRLERAHSLRWEEEQAHARRLRYQVLQGDVGTALSEPGSLASCLQRCCEALVRHIDVSVARVWTSNARSGALELQASAGVDTVEVGIPVGQQSMERITRERAPLLTNDAFADSRLEDKVWARREGMVAFAGCPLLVGGQLVGGVALFATAPLQDHVLTSLTAVADSLAQGIERRRAEQALAVRAEELARSNAELERFAYVASHDLQEPLRMVSSYTQLLARRYKGQLDADADEFIGFAVEGVTRMQRLIQDLLAYSRVGTRGQLFSLVDTGQLLARVLTELEQRVAEANASIIAGALPVVRADEVQLGQLFQNLLSNSLKFRGGVAAPEVRISAEARGSEWLFTFRDNGIGIAPEYFDRIFIIFQRLHTRAEFPGTGIGLAICKKVVERHGGKIWVESAPGQGATFYFTLPVAPPSVELGSDFVRPSQY